MKFETVRVDLVMWRFWFVVWCKTFAPVATWPNKNNNINNLTRPQHTILYISLTLFCKTTMWNFLTHFMLENVVCAHQCFVMFLFTSFLHCRSFSPCWPLFLIFSPPISMFFEICLLFFVERFSSVVDVIRDFKILSDLSLLFVFLSSKSGWTFSL